MDDDDFLRVPDPAKCAITMAPLDVARSLQVVHDVGQRRHPRHPIQSTWRSRWGAVLACAVMPRPYPTTSSRTTVPSPPLPDGRGRHF